MGNTPFCTACLVIPDSAIGLAELNALGLPASSQSEEAGEF